MPNWVVDRGGCSAGTLERQKAVGQEAQRGVVVEAWPGPPLEMVQTQLLLELLIALLHLPARLPQTDRFVQAVEAAGKIRFRPELALTHVRLAELLLEEADEAARSEALAHLGTAIPELREMKMHPALQRALALNETYRAPPTHISARPATSDGLTAREREIASLMTDRLTNREIAERLVITEGTVEVHVRHILGKLGFSSRRQATAWVARQWAGESGTHRA